MIIIADGILIAVICALSFHLLLERGWYLGAFGLLVGSMSLIMGFNIWLFNYLANRRIRQLSSSLVDISEKRNRHLFLPSSPPKISSAIAFHFDQLLADNEQLFSEMQEIKSIYNSILNTQEELVFIIDKDGYISYRNRAFDEMFGAPSLDFDRKSFSFSENLSFLMQQISPLFLKSPAEERQKNMVSKIEIKGRKRHISWAVNFVSDIEPRRILFVGRDETDDIEAKERSERLQKIATVGRAASTIFHEINQPLSIMQLSSFMMQSSLESVDDHLSPKIKQELVDNARIIEGQINRANQIINNLRLFHSGDKKRLSHEVIAVDELIRESISLVAPEIDVNQISLETRTDGAADVTIRGNKTLFTQVIVNILKNSVQALCAQKRDRPRKITVSFSTVKDRAFIAIEDTGPGIPESDLIKATEPFFTTKEEGSGLGLALCLDILNSYRGNMELRNTSPHGLLTTISVPLADGLPAIS